MITKEIKEQLLEALQYGLDYAATCAYSANQDGNYEAAGDASQDKRKIIAAIKTLEGLEVEE